MPAPPLIVVEGPTPSALARARADVVQDGWTVVEGWSRAGRGSVCAASVRGEEDAVRAVLAAIGGAGLILEATADRALLDRLCDDLRRIGPLDHRVAAGRLEDAALSVEESDLLRLLMAGASLGEAARALSLSRRTADRRLASARRALGAATTSEALVLARRQGLGPR